MQKVFISFDYDDLDVKQGLVAQAKMANAPFEFSDHSIKERVAEAWVAEARQLIGEANYVFVICGEQTHQSKGAETELQITKEMKKPYALLRGTRKNTPTRPKSASPTEPMYAATWPTVAALLRGERPPVQ